MAKGQLLSCHFSLSTRIAHALWAPTDEEPDTNRRVIPLGRRVPVTEGSECVSHAHASWLVTKSTSF